MFLKRLDGRNINIEYLYIKNNAHFFVACLEKLWRIESNYCLDQILI